MKKRNIIFIMIVFILLENCGEGVVTVDKSNYEPKIVIEGYLYPDSPVSGIRLTRNIPLNQNIDISTLVLTNARAEITDLSQQTIYQLTFNGDSAYYEYTEIDLQIRAGGSYRLDISARIDGVDLSATSVTTVPQTGFSIIDSASTSSLIFGQRDLLGYAKPRILFDRSVQTDYYAFSIVALDASVDNFIYDIHPWGGNIKEKDVMENMDDFKHSHDTVFNTPLTASSQEWMIEWFHLWFYSRYRIIGYAGDKNMKNYYLTHANVQEMDGNLHEPAFNIEGDGIGVFGSAIADTFYFEVLRP